MKSTVGFVCTLLICVQIINAGYFIDDYYISHPLKVSWWEASRFCTFYGNQLIDIPDEKEYRNVLATINKVRKNDSSIVDNSIWTSGIRFPDERTYYWENSGLPVIYADWAQGDPHLGKDEKCLFLWRGDNWKLADSLCDQKYVFMCRVLSTS